ncbi:MAG: GTPase HflX [Gammaproteobacteria bacterium]
MFERPRTGERAVLVHINFGGSARPEQLEEFRELARSAGALEVAVVTGAAKTPDAKYFVGSGKAEEIAGQVADHAGEVVLFNHALSPAQERNLERLLKCRVLDRTGLILDIFAQRARSFEGKLQVELAQLRHVSTRLIRGWTHLERQKGGIGLRGPGETQLETDRRLIGQRIKHLNARLEKVSRQRAQGRRARIKAELPTLSLVGYTNAGKSTLFNRLTGADAYAANQLFATLDPTLRRIELPGHSAVVLADTVGFIRDLPHDLVAAFRSTLEETVQAALLLQVIDAHDEERHVQIAEVDGVLQELGAGSVPQIQIFNKIDLIPGREPRIDRDEEGRAVRVWVSARTGAGIDLLLKAIAERLGENQVRRVLRLPPSASRLRSRLFDLATVVDEAVDEQGTWRIEVKIGRGNFEYLCRREGLKRQWVESAA